MSTLSDVAEALRSLGARVESGKLRTTNAGTLAGKQLDLAMGLGLFSGQQWWELREAISAAERGQLAHQLGHPPGTEKVSGTTVVLSPPPAWHAFVNAVAWLHQSQAKDADVPGEQLVAVGCSLIADLIDGHETEGEELQPTEALSQRQYDSLIALYENEAFSDAKRLTAATVAVKAEGKAANEDGFKKPLSDMVRDGLLGVKKGRNGGYWLTDKGKAAAEKR